MRSLLTSLALLFVGCGASPRLPLHPAAPAIEILPDIAVTTLDDRPARLVDVLAHRPALVAVWATWCDACKNEEAALDRLDRAAGPRGGIVVGLSVGESSVEVREDLRVRPRGYMQLVDEPFALEAAAGVHSLPTVFVVDARGRVVHAGGALDHAALAAFRELLGETE